MKHTTKQAAEPHLTWSAMVSALKAGHSLPKPRLGDQFLHRGDDTLLSRAAWIDGLGAGVKTVTVIPENTGKNLPSIHGIMTLFDDKNGAPIATLDSGLVTKWKTAADSLLGATLLANDAPKVLAIMGTGAVAESLVEAYPVLFPTIERIHIWSRNPEKARSFAAMHRDNIEVFSFEMVKDAVHDADIVSTATMSKKPILHGDWIKAGTHIDLIGAFKPDMREADDTLLKMGRLFVDCRETTIGHIGEIMIPLASGVLHEADVIGDYYDLCSGCVGRQSQKDITILKNGGGAHLDVMCAHAILSAMEHTLSF